MSVRTMSPANGIGPECRSVTGGAFNPLARLIAILRQNDDLLARLEAQGLKLARARSYADDPASNVALGSALVEHARKGYVNLLSILRGNRAEALGILRACGHADLPEAS